VHFHPDVHIREWRENAVGGDILHREYSTPGGNLAAAVRLSEDWPHGDHIPFVDDFQVSRALKPLVTKRSELEALQYLFQPPITEDEILFRHEAAKARAFAEEHGVLLAGGWGVGLDMANWLCGVQNLILLAVDEPEFVIDLLQMIHVWNKRRMEVVLSAPVDLFIRRAWYEGCDFVTPGFFREAVLPRLKAEVDLAHERGAKFGYICSSGTRPMLNAYLEAGIDVLIGIDPVQGRQTDLELLKRVLGQRVCLWGGVSGAITVEMGSEMEVRAAVQKAIQALGPTGFILSPVDNITVDEPRTWRNIEVLIDESCHHGSGFPRVRPRAV